MTADVASTLVGSARDERRGDVEHEDAHDVDERVCRQKLAAHRQAKRPRAALLEVAEHPGERKDEHVEGVEDDDAPNLAATRGGEPVDQRRGEQHAEPEEQGGPAFEERAERRLGRRRSEERDEQS
jgi:hypothetical protein